MTHRKLPHWGHGGEWLKSGQTCFTALLRLGPLLGLAPSLQIGSLRSGGRSLLVEFYAVSAYLSFDSKSPNRLCGLRILFTSLKSGLALILADKITIHWWAALDATD